MLESALWLKIHEFLIEVGGAPTREEFFKLVFDRIQLLIPYDVGVGFFDVSTTRILHGAGLPESANKIYNDYYAARQPWQKKPQESRKFAVTCRVDWHEYRDSEYVTDFVRPNGFMFSLAQPLAHESSLSLHRSRWVSHFSDQERDILGIINPHLVNLLHFHDRIARTETLPSSDQIREEFPRLSRRESEVAELLCLGLSANEIATRLFISARTVETHILRIYEKLKVQKRGSAVSTLLSRVCGHAESV